MLNRRGFLCTSSLVSLLPTMPSFMGPLVSAMEATASNGRILVVLQLDGGNDGINTVIPIDDEGYDRHRRDLRLRKSELLKMSDKFAFHPELRGIGQLFEQGRLSIAHGVGYPNPNRSHFESMKVWHAGSTDPEIFRSSSGWIGESFGSQPVEPGSTQAIHVGDESIPQALRGRRCNASTFLHPDEMRLVRRSPHDDRVATDSSQDSLTAFVSDHVKLAYASSMQIQEAIREEGSNGYPESRLGKKLKMISQLIKSDLSTRVYYTTQGGYDTHAGQLPVHANLLSELSNSMKAFMDDLQRSGLEDRVLVLAFSEFGRRVEENASFGTDHGTAGLFFWRAQSWPIETTARFLRFPI